MADPLANGAHGLTPTNLPDRIRRLGLPETVARIAVEGGESVHPELWYRAGAVREASWSVMEHSGDAGLVPLWTCDIVTSFAHDDGHFLIWSAELSEPSDRFDDFAGLVRSLLTDLWEDEQDDARPEIAELLLPAAEVAAALVPEER